MADEITFRLKLVYSKGVFSYTYDPGEETFDFSGTGGGAPGMVDVGTSEEDISFGDVSGAGIIFMRNLGANNVDWGKKDGSGNMQAIGTLTASGPPAVFVMEASATLRMQASGGSSKCDIRRFEA